MTKAVLRWALPLAALLVVGSIGGWMTGSLRATDGATDTTALASASPVMGLAAAIGALLLAVAAGVFTSHLIGSAFGMWACGLALMMAAWRFGTVDQILLRERASSPLISMAIEGLILGLIGFVGCAAIVAAGRREDARLAELHPGAPPIPASFRDALVGALKSKELPLVIIAGAIGALLAAWLIGQSPAKGQAIAGAFGAGIAAGAVGRFAGAFIEDSAPASAYMLAMALASTLGPVVALVAGGSGVVDASLRGSLIGTANLIPMDWLAGAFMGLPIGLRWVGAHVQQGEPSRASASR